MKNRLQFNRIPFLYSSGETLYSGTSVGLSGRETALSGLTWFTTRRNFIPLIGEPIVVRYIDDKGRKQLMLAIGKATGSTADDTYGIEYHVIDSAKLQEDIDLANAHAAEALDLASAATHDIANHLVILKNMIGENGIFMEDGSFFDGENDDPSKVGLYKNWSGNPVPYETTYISAATNMFEADLMLDAAIKEQAANLETLSGVTIETIQSLNDLWEATGALSAATIEFSASTVAALNEINENVEELSAATESFSAGTSSLFETIIEAAGLNTGERGSYPGHDETHIIKSATSLDHADVLLDAALWDLSGNTIAVINELSAGTLQLSADTDATIHELSAGTVSGLDYLSGITKNIIGSAGLNDEGEYTQVTGSTYIRDAENMKDVDRILDATLAELSANTMAADQVLQEQITEIGNRKILGESAITVNVSNGDSTILLKLANNEKVLTQDISGLKTNISLVYIKEDKKIYLVGKDDEQENPIVISEVDASDFIKDGMLDHVNVFVATEEDHREYPQLVVGETYLALYFNTDAVSGGTVSPAFISVKDLVDVYTVSATSLNYLTIEGYEIRANVDVEHGLAGYDGVMNISGITDNIIAAAGLNLGGQGTYPGHDETHIIKDATSLDNADVLLDAAIWGVSGNVLEVSGAAVYNETIINNILEGTGLNTQDPGEYHGHDETHYIKDATSLDDADVKLDEALWALSGVVADLGDVSELEEKIDRLSAVTKEFSATTDTLIRELSARTVDLQEVYDYIDSADTRLNERIDEVEEVTAAALNDLNERVGYVETHMTGEYIPLTGYELSSGLTEEELLVTDEDTVDEAFGKIQKQILDDEEATAAALNDLNDRVNANAQAIAENTGVTALSAAVMSFSSATVNEFSEVHNDITNIENDITNINTNIENVSSFTQFLSAHSLGMLTVNLNGVEQGKYCPSASTTLNLEAIQEVTGADVLLTGYELATGTTEEELAVVPTDTVNDAFGKVQKQIYDNEAVTAGALNDLDGRVLELSGVVIDDELVVAAALNDLNSRIAEVSGNVEELATNAITGVSVDGVAQPVVDNVANIQNSIPSE